MDTRRVRPVNPCWTITYRMSLSSITLCDGESLDRITEYVEESFIHEWPQCIS